MFIVSLLEHKLTFKKIPLDSIYFYKTFYLKKNLNYLNILNIIFIQHLFGFKKECERMHYKISDLLDLHLMGIFIPV